MLTPSEPFPSWPHFDHDLIAAAESVLRSGKVNYWTGHEGLHFEREFAEFVGCAYALAVTSGTAALELALRALGIGPGSEVITTARTFIATAGAVVAVGARPVFVDVDAESQNLTAESIRGAITPATRAILAVHLGGWPCDMPAIAAIAREHGLLLVEDCAQALGATLNGRQVGSFGDIAAFSFCQDKIITTAGEGGMVCTSNQSLWKKMWSLRDHGKDFDAVHAERESSGFRWLHESFGSNMRMTEVQSAIGRVALKKLPAWLERRRANASYLAERLGRLASLRISQAPAHIGHAYYRFYAFLRSEQLAGIRNRGKSRDKILQELTALGIPCGSGSCSEVYLEKAFPLEWRPPQRLPIARELGETSLAFPVHPTLERQHMERICDAVESVFQRAAKHGSASPRIAQRHSAHKPEASVPAFIPAGGNSPLQTMKLDDLLGRAPVPAESCWEHSGLRGRVVMVTGAAGSIGSELCTQILRCRPAKLVCLDQAETPLFHLQKKLHAQAEVEKAFIVADITDRESMRHHLLRHGVHAIFHAAAYKHVPLSEDNPCEALKNNVFGLIDLLECAERCGCDDFLLISTDKAVKPAGVMGCTKRLGEMILGSKPLLRMRSVSVRFGNVLGSQGSVVPIFQEQIRRGLPVTVTHPQMTRYFMTIPEAAHLVVQAFTVGNHGDILVLDMGQPVRIVDLARTLIRLLGRSENEVTIQYSGIRPGEKLHEELFYNSETPEPTSIPRVKYAKCRPPAWPQLSRQLRELRECSLSRDSGRIREKLKQMIPEYEWTAPQKQEQKQEQVQEKFPVLADMDGSLSKEQSYSVHTTTSTGVGL
jgi:dTDP-4-amino-4,6-dideoxygalactose transaminase/nucleoside-diphosphate-sugar epimerase